MVSKINPSVSIEIGGKKRKLLFNLNAMAAFEEATGKSAFASEATGSAKDLRALLWACLLHEDENLTLKEVGSWVRSDNLKEITNALVQAFNAAMPESEAKEEGPLAKKPLAG